MLLPQNINEAAQLQQLAYIELLHRQCFCCITELWLYTGNSITSGLSHKFTAKMILPAGYQNEYVPLTYRRQKKKKKKVWIKALFFLFLLHIFSHKSRSTFYRVSPHLFLFKLSNFPVLTVSLRKKKKKSFR